jgi:hypothetical protein
MYYCKVSTRCEHALSPCDLSIANALANQPVRAIIYHSCTTCTALDLAQRDHLSCRHILRCKRCISTARPQRLLLTPPWLMLMSPSARRRPVPVMQHQVSHKPSFSKVGAMSLPAQNFIFGSACPGLASEQAHVAFC